MSVIQPAQCPNFPLQSSGIELATFATNRSAQTRIIWCPVGTGMMVHRPPDSLFIDVLHGEGGVLPQLLGLLLQLAPGQDAVHWHRHQLDLNLVVWGNVVLQETRHCDSGSDKRTSMRNTTSMYGTVEKRDQIKLLTGRTPSTHGVS